MRLFTVLPLLFAALSPGGTAPAPAGAQKALAPLYALACTALTNPTPKNVDASFALLAPDYVDIDPNGGVHKRAEVVARERAQFNEMTFRRCSNTMGAVTQPAPGTLVVVDTMHVSGSVRTPAGSQPMDVTSKTADTWKRTAGTWLQTQSKSLRSLVKVDGIVVQDSGN